MRYIRFVKPPYAEFRGDGSPERACMKVTITSDLGDSFCHDQVKLDAALLLNLPSAFNLEGHQRQSLVASERQVTWKPGMRELPVNLPISRHLQDRDYVIRVGALQPEAPLVLEDELEPLVSMHETQSSCNTVSAWSHIPYLGPRCGRSYTSGRGPAVGGKGQTENSNASKRVQRRFRGAQGRPLHIWEAGSSYAEHIWDAGLILAAYLDSLSWSTSRLGQRNGLKEILDLTQNSSEEAGRLKAIELGTGCGIVGIQLASCYRRCDVTLTDLPSAAEIVESNLAAANLQEQSSARFEALDWDDHDASASSVWDPPGDGYDLILVSDCTYNWDVIPALVRTIARLASIRANRAADVGSSPVNSSTLTVIAMKKRHDDEDLFFDEMAKQRLQQVDVELVPIPIDDSAERDPLRDSVAIITFRLNQDT